MSYHGSKKNIHDISVLSKGIKKKCKFKEPKKYCGCNEVNCQKSKTGGCNDGIQIRAKDISNKTGYTINEPGVYCLIEDVNWAPKTDNISAITINSNNVTLLLGERTIKQVQGITRNNIGVNIRNNKQNIKVKDGKLIGFTGLGILINEGVDTIIISGLIIKNVGYNGLFNVPNYNRPFSGGILSFGQPGNEVKNVLIEGLTISDVVGKYPIGSSNLPEGGANGITIIRTNVSIINDAKISNLISNDAAAPIFYGNSIDIILKDSVLTRAQGDRNANGIDTMANTADINRSNHRITVDNVYISNISAVGVDPNGNIANEALGLELNGDNFVYRNVYISGISAVVGAPNRAIGLVVQSSSQNGVVEDCYVSDVSCIGNIAYGYSIGSSTDSLLTGITILFSQAKKINLLNNPTGTAAGFFHNRGTGTIFQECVAENVTALNPSNGFGFALAGSTGVSINASYVQNNQTGIVVRDQGSVAATNNIVEKNLINGNTVFAIDDVNAGKSTAYYRNIARVPNLTLAYNNLPMGTPIRQWQIGSAPSATDNNGASGEILDNIIIYTS